MKWKFLLLASVFCFLIVRSQEVVQGKTAVSDTTAAPDIADLWLTAADFAEGSGHGYHLTPSELTLADTAVTARYVSPIISAPIPFNAVVPQWIADTPDGTQLYLWLRTANAAGDWSDWFSIAAQDDWMLPDDPDIVGDMVVVHDTHTTHTQIQYAVNLSRSGSELPALQQLRFTFIDTSKGPTTAELVARQQALDAQQGITKQTDGFPKPFVISRDVWCTYPECVYNNVEHYPVTQLIMHHTVTANDYTDGVAVVQAIWRFHTFTRGWGDIGYNYLVDLNGNRYEGHYGGDDAVGIHASGANRGSMAVSLIGTFTTANDNPPGIAPPPAMLNAAADLFAWKADQKGINVFDASDSLPDIDWGLPNLMGHRDVYGGSATECPGEQAYQYLPWMRQAVAERIGLTDPYFYTDELSGNFSKSNATWYEGTRGCGHNGHSYYTWSTTNPGASTNWGEWRPQVPATGRYEIQVYAPYCDTGASETDGARYTIQHLNGTTNVVISQNDHVGLWMSLGEFDLAAGTGNVIRLSDLTSTDDGRGIWFDALRLRPVEGTAVLSQPTTDSWSQSLTVNFLWSFTNPLMVAQTKLLVATDENFNNVIINYTWDTAVTNYTYTFSQQYANLYWKIIMSSTLGNDIPSTVFHFGLDRDPPTSKVSLIYQYPGDNTYHIVWQGSDNLSGITRYNIDYRAADATTWTTWFINTTSTDIAFTPPNGNQIYWFRSQAIDRAGNVESLHSSGDISTSEAIVLSHVIMLPMIVR